MNLTLLVTVVLSVAAAKPAAPAGRDGGGGKTLVVLMEAGSVSAEFRASLMTTLQREVERSINYRWVEPPAITVDELALAINCTGMDDNCLRRAGDNLKAENVMLVAASGGGRKELVLSLVAVRPPKPTRMAAVPLVESAATIQDVRQALRSLLGPVKPTRLVITTDPPGAQVTLDGKAVGTSPYTVNDLAEGRHAVSVVAEGYQAQSVDVDLAGGQAQDVRMTLQKKVAAPVSAATPTPATSGTGTTTTPPTSTGDPAPVAAAPTPVAEEGDVDESGGTTRWLAVVPGAAGLALGVGALAVGILMLIAGPVSFGGIWALNGAVGPMGQGGFGFTQTTAFVALFAFLSGGAVVAVAGLLVTALSGAAAAASAVLAATVL